MNRLLLSLATLATLSLAQERLTLEQAEELAVKQHPRLRSQQQLTEATRAQVQQVKGTLQPFLAGNFTSSVADHASRIGAGGLNASSLFSRVGTGVAINQTLWDFGRTSKLAESVGSRVEAQSATAETTRRQVRWEARQAFLRAVALERSMSVAKTSLTARQTLQRQIQALVENQLRSTLDLQFAEVAVGEAETTVARLEGDLKAAYAVLATALGYTEERTFALEEPAPLAFATETLDELVREALGNRPEVAVRKYQAAAAKQFAESERRLMFPSVTAAGVFGAVPAGDPRLRTRYGGAGINLNIPVFNGRTFQARRQEADFRASSADQDTKDAELRVAREVRTAHADAQNAERRLQLAEKQLGLAQRLTSMAETRYQNGLGSIMELNQAQISQMSAELGATAARYDVALARGWLAYTVGRLR